MNETMVQAFNQQMNREFDSAYLYLAMAAYCDHKNQPGIAHWLRVQSREELDHALRFFNFIIDRGGRVNLAALPAPAGDFASLTAVFEEVLRHEQAITAGIHELYAHATEQKDWASIPFLQAFVAEQVEEEKSAADALTMVQMAEASPQALFLLNREMAARTAPDQ